MKKNGFIFSKKIDNKGLSMLIKLKPLFLSYFLLLGFVAFSQTESTSSPDQSIVFKPTIGLGTGLFSFYGDVGGNTYANPKLSRIGYDLSVSNNFNEYLSMRFYVLFGKLGVNERSPNRNLNFESTIRTGGLSLVYNFGNFLRSGRALSPYITTGIESFEFLSKSDLFDQHGNKYHYWSDGSIRNIEENSTEAENSIILVRDYTYESDLREANLDGFGKYPERSFAVPVGAGIILHLSERVDFKLGSTLHFTFTDLLDNVTAESIGSRAGNKQNDRFLMSSFSINYDLYINKKDKNEDDAYDSEGDLLADLDDEDKDGVIDYKDLSPFTLPGVVVDTAGRPLDDDSDNIANYLDDEIMSPEGSIVTTKGVALSDSLMEAIYLTYMDSTGEFARRINLNEGTTPKSKDVYVIQLGQFKTGVPPELINKYLNVSDITSTVIDGETHYTAGRYYNYNSAEERQKQLVSNGITDAKVALFKGGKITAINSPVPSIEAEAVAANKTTNNITESNKGNVNENKENGSSTANETGEAKSNSNDINSEKETSKNQTIDTAITPAEKSNSTTTTVKPPVSGKGVVYRVQIGAYRRNVSKEIFSGINDLITVTADNGITKYLTGNFTDFEKAAKHKVDMIVKGYEGAFIVAYKDGERVTLESTGVNIAAKDDVIEPEDETNNAINKDLITFKVQVGVFKNEVPSDIRQKFSKIKGLEVNKTPEGLTRYTAGNFKDYQSAQKAKKDIVDSGIEGAFIIAYFKDRLIDVQEAIELLK